MKTKMKKYIAQTSTILFCSLLLACDGKNEQDNTSDPVMQQHVQSLEKAESVEKTILQTDQKRQDQEGL